MEHALPPSPFLHPLSPVLGLKGGARIWDLPVSGRDVANVPSRAAFRRGVYPTQTYYIFTNVVFMS